MLFFQVNEDLILSDFTAASYGMLSGAARSILFPRVPNLPMVRALGKLCSTFLICSNVK